jgi:predicted ribosomally synthesized peptide with nif11-like leader
VTQTIAMNFIAEATANPKLRDQVKAAGNDVSALLKVATSAGFNITAEELEAAKQAIHDLRTRGEAPLSDDELEMIAGGSWGNGANH